MMEKIYNGNWITYTVSHKVDCRARKHYLGKAALSIVTRGIQVSTYQEDIILNLYHAPNNRSPKYMKQN